ncbi:MAG: DHHA1 domain-containing protein [Planctomycetota bacterium]|nr:DHHA1 domain-containing protein [Planctomycetota bacterium]
MGEEALERIRAARPDLLITLDNGVTAHDAVAALRADGIDTIVVDHHHIPEAGLPPAVAVVNPQREDHAYPFRELCGAGLAFKLAWALAQAFSHAQRVTPAFRAFLLDALGFAALGTVCDVVPLRGENRILVAQGLKAVAHGRAPGLAALVGVCQLRGEPTVTDIGFLLGPRLNAAGRCARAAEALELLLTEDPARAAELAQRLDALNAERQSIEQKILDEARAQAAERLKAAPPPSAFVLGSAGWHQGVIGIVASRIVEEFHRPAVLLALDEAAGTARGSGRSISGFHLAEALAAAGAHLTTYGGHAAAAGLSAPAANVEAFRAAFEAVASAQLSPGDLQASLHVEEFVPLNEVTGAFCRDLERLDPCGMGNPRPVLAAQDVRVAGQVKPMGADERHLSFFAAQAGQALRAVGFGMGEHFNKLCELGQAGSFEIAFSPVLNHFRGQTNVELHLRAFRAG